MILIEILFIEVILRNSVSYISWFLGKTYRSSTFSTLFYPLKKLKVGGFKTGDGEFQFDIATPFFEFVDFIASYKSSRKLKKWVKPMREKREKVPFIELYVRIFHFLNIIMVILLMFILV